MDENIIIKDKRVQFKKLSFSNYKKSDVKKNLITSIYYQKLEESFFWTGEMLCSNMLLELWDTYMIIMSKYIHIYNPKLPIYINKKFNDFKHIVSIENNDLKLRNHREIRMILFSITTILCFSDKYTILDDLKYKFNFNIENLYENLKAPNIEYINFIYTNDDPREYIVPFNELVYHLKETKTKTDINFWMNWIINYDILCRKKKKYILCKQRDFYYNKNEKISKNIIWIIWDLILKLSKELHSDLIQRIIYNLFELFKIRYTISTNKKRIFLFYHSIELLLLGKSIDLNKELLKNKNILKNLEKNINIIFEQIKNNEQDVIEEKSNKTKKMEMYKDIYNNL